MLKKDRAKRKKEKRQEKEQRRENRRTSTESTSFEDMIAYVDEHGNIVDTPPEPRKPEKIELDSIQISTPKKEDIADEPLKGLVEFYNTEKGFGFIKNLNSVEKYFFHINNAFESITEGNIVTFDLERGDRGMSAVNVKLA